MQRVGKINSNQHIALHKATRHSGFYITAMDFRHLPQNSHYIRPLFRAVAILHSHGERCNYSRTPMLPETSGSQASGGDRQVCSRGRGAPQEREQPRQTNGKGKSDFTHLLPQFQKKKVAAFTARYATDGENTTSEPNMGSNVARERSGGYHSEASTASISEGDSN
ncbi:uncharacterized protein LOC144774269 isoform X1 [Lissotriton helveticus]